MKRLMLFLFIVNTVILAECPQKVKEITEGDIKSYFSKFHKKLDGLKIECHYDRNSNIFNLEHKIKTTARLNKSELDFNFTTHSSIFNLFNFSDFQGTLCHKGLKKKGVDDFGLIKKSFFKGLFKQLENQKKIEQVRNGKICYSAEIKKKKRSRKAKLI